MVISQHVQTLVYALYIYIYARDCLQNILLFYNKLYGFKAIPGLKSGLKMVNILEDNPISGRSDSSNKFPTNLYD